MSAAKLMTFHGQVQVKCSDGSVETIKGSKISSDMLVVESPYNSDRGTCLTIILSLLVGEQAKKVEAQVEVVNATYTGHRQNYRIEFSFKKFSGDGREVLENFINERSNAFGFNR